MPSASPRTKPKGLPGNPTLDDAARRWRGTKKRRSYSAPIVAAVPNRAVFTLARFALLLTAVAWFAYVIEQGIAIQRSGLDFRTSVETAVYVIFVTLLSASAFSYLLARLGNFHRVREHRRVPRSEIDDHFDHAEPSVTVIIPSYREDERLIRQTLLSSALQEYPALRVVLLVDDPPNPTESALREQLERARALPKQIQQLLDGPRRSFEKSLAAFENDAEQGHMASAKSLRRLAKSYEEAAEWFAREGAALEMVDHSDHFLATEFFERMQNDFKATADALNYAANERSANVSRHRVFQLHRRLVHTFKVEVTSFERKQFASLSHEANKAMNLNSYIGLMGGRYSIANSPGGRVLVPAGSRTPDLIVPDCDYVLTVDADSILLPEYCLRLVHFMEQSENADVAVVQTPYSAFRGVTSRLERIAGATTDIQQIVHQGMTKYNATFWVGANAIIRKVALNDLEEESSENGFIIRRYIKDRTVIEDTESSIDLRARGWRLHNYPERLSYSATPADFGSLVIQRQRWSNGGLVIMPSLIRLIRKREPGVSRPGPAEILLRTNYLASISWSSVGLLMLLFYPFEGELLSRFAVLTALPYFIAMSSDLKRVGYSRLAIFPVYGFNLLLLPVSLAGTIQSIVQGIGGQKIAFARTPKVQNRTVAPLMFILLPVLLIALSARTLTHDIDTKAYIHGAFAATNLVMTSYACWAFVGPRAMLADVFINIRAFIYRPEKPAKPEVLSPHWASVLYVGSSIPEHVARNTPLAVALAAYDHMPERKNPALANDLEHGVRVEPVTTTPNFITRPARRDIA